MAAIAVVLVFPLLHRGDVRRCTGSTGSAPPERSGSTGADGLTPQLVRSSCVRCKSPRAGTPDQPGAPGVPAGAVLNYSIVLRIAASPWPIVLRIVLNFPEFAVVGMQFYEFLHYITKTAAARATELPRCSRRHRSIANRIS